MCGNNDSGNSMPEQGKKVQAVECLVDIRKGAVASSLILVFDSGQLSGGNEQEKRPASFSKSGGAAKKAHSQNSATATPCQGAESALIVT